MRSAETVLGIIQERGKKGLPLEDVYRQLFNPNLYLLAYGRIYRNRGAMTAGATDETVDGMSLAKIEAIIAALRYESYRWTPVRRVYIAKKNSAKQRALGLPTWSDKLLQEVIRLLLEAYYEPQFSPTSHGFRPNRGCHTALREIQHRWVGTKWFIEGDIAACFDTLDHSVLLSILNEQIHDNRFLRLIAQLLNAGYLEQWRYHATLSGSPQGAVVSPILADICLDRLDQFVEQTLLPKYTRGDQRHVNSEWQRRQQLTRQLKQQGQGEAARKMRRQMQQVPSKDPTDPDYRRLRYVRYADDVLLGFSGPRCEAEEIRVHHIRQLKELRRRYRGRNDPPAWVTAMAAMRRKTLVVCQHCHRAIHAGRYDGPRLTCGLLESRMTGKPSRPVRRGRLEKCQQHRWLFVPWLAGNSLAAYPTDT